jgi:hypothetical protein
LLNRALDTLNDDLELVIYKHQLAPIAGKKPTAGPFQL